MTKWRAEVLLFDFDGTLIDTKVDIATAVNLTLEDLGLPLRTVEEIFSFVGDGVKRLLRLSVGEENPDHYDRALAVFRRHYLENCVQTTKWYPGIREVLQHYKDRRKVIVTNKSLVIDGLQAQDLFQHVEAPRDSAELKPEPVMLERALEVLGADPARTVMIGDSTNDVRAARAAGIRGCAVGYGYGNREKVTALQPDFYCETPHDLLDLF
jgi:phosphoglycolate phosphatase